MKEAVLSLGTNLGDRPDNLHRAIHSLEGLPGTKVISVSSFYETEPFGVEDQQPLYINCCLRLETALSPHALLGACLGIEAAMGRKRMGIKSARIIDIDILLYSGVRQDEPELVLPHPRMLERVFVLAPLAELFPDGQALDLPFSVALARVDKSGIWKRGK